MTRHNSTGAASASASAASGSAGAASATAYNTRTHIQADTKDTIFIGEYPFYPASRNEYEYCIKVLRTCRAAIPVGENKHKLLCGEGNSRDGFMLFLLEVTSTPIDFESDTPKRQNIRKKPFTARQVENKDGQKTIGIIERGVDKPQLHPSKKQGKKFNSITLVTPTLSPDTFRSQLSGGLYVGVFIDVKRIKPSRFFPYDNGTYKRPYDAMTRDIIERRLQHLRENGRLYDTLEQLGLETKLEGRINEVLARVFAIEDIGIFETNSVRADQDNLAADFEAYPIESRILASARCFMLNQRLRNIEKQFGLAHEALGVRKIYFYSNVPVSRKFEYTKEQQKIDIEDPPPNKKMRDDFIESYQKEAQRLFAYESTTASHIAASLNKLDEITDINCENSRGHTPLHFAAMNGHANLVIKLLRDGADIKNDYKGCNFIAVTHVNKRPDYTAKILDLLCLPENCDLFFYLEKHSRLIDSAIEINHTPALKILRDHYSRFTTPLTNINTTIKKLTLFPIATLIPFILSCHADTINALYAITDGLKIIQLAVIQGEFEFFKALWEKEGVDTEVKTKYNESLLELAIYYRRLDIARYIIEKQTQSLSDVHKHNYFYNDPTSISSETSIYNYIIAFDDIALFESLILSFANSNDEKSFLIASTLTDTPNPTIQAYQLFKHILESQHDHFENAIASNNATRINFIIDALDHALNPRCIDTRFATSLVSKINQISQSTATLVNYYHSLINKEDISVITRLKSALKRASISISFEAHANKDCVSTLLRIITNGHHLNQKDTFFYHILESIITLNTNGNTPIYEAFWTNNALGGLAQKKPKLFLCLVNIPHFKKNVIAKFRSSPDTVREFVKIRPNKRIIRSLTDYIQTPALSEYTLLHGTCHLEYTDSFKAVFAISKSALNLPDHIGKTPILYALTKAGEKIIAMLVNSGADLSVIDNEQKNVLHALALNISKRASNNFQLIKRQVNIQSINKKDIDGNTPLHTCLITGNYLIAKHLIVHCLNNNIKIDFNARNNAGVSIIFLLSCRKPDLLFPLLRYKLVFSDEQLTENHHGITALQHIAVEANGKTPAMSTLFKQFDSDAYNKSLAVVDIMNNTIVHLLLLKLIELGDPKLKQYKTKETALLYFLKQSIKKDIAKLPHSNDIGDSWLHLAIKTNNKDIITCALNTISHKKYQDFNPNSQDRDGNTILHLAIAYSTPETTRLIIQHFPGININIENSHNQTPGELCRTHANPAVGTEHHDVITLYFNMNSTSQIPGHHATTDLASIKDNGRDGISDFDVFLEQWCQQNDFRLGERDEVGIALARAAAEAAAASTPSAPEMGAAASAAASAGAAAPASQAMPAPTMTRQKAAKRPRPTATTTAAAASTVGMFAHTARPAASANLPPKKTTKKARIRKN